MSAQGDEGDGFATSDLAEALAGGGGPVRAREAAKRLDELQAAVAARAAEGLPPAQSEAYRQVSRGLVTAKAVVLLAARKDS
jgi:hypothetical protein